MAERPSFVERYSKVIREMPLRDDAPKPAPDGALSEALETLKTLAMRAERHAEIEKHDKRREAAKDRQREAKHLREIIVALSSKLAPDGALREALERALTSFHEIPASAPHLVASGKAQLLETIFAALAQPQPDAPAQADWSPIETHPKDREFLVANSTILGGFMQVVAWDEDEPAGLLLSQEGLKYSPGAFTHWTDLPDPPASDDAPAREGGA